MASTVEAGRRGEDRAAAYLEGRGYRVVARNVRHGRGEVDLVAVDGRTGETVFVEVKYRSTDRMGTGAEAVGPAKLARVRRVAAGWLAAHPGAGRGGARIDVVDITGGRLTHLEGVDR